MEHVKCNLCGADDTALLFRGKDTAYDSPHVFNIVKCRRCGLAYINPRPSQKEMHSFYHDDYYPKFVPSGRTFSGAKKIIMETYFGYGRYNLFKKLFFLPLYFFRSLFLNRGAGVNFVRNGKFLDVGFGDGSLLYEYKSLGFDAYGTEVSGYAVRNARRLGLKVFKGELRDVRFKGNYFDVVYLSHVLEHVHDPLSVLVEIRRILKKRGVAVIVLPNFGSLEARILKGNWDAGLEIPRHLYHFSPRTVKKIALRAGFKKIRVDYLPLQTTLAGSLSHILKKKGIKANIFNRYVLIFLVLPITFMLSIFRQSGIVAVYLER